MKRFYEGKSGGGKTEWKGEEDHTGRLAGYISVIIWWLLDKAGSKDKGAKREKRGRRLACAAEDNLPMCCWGQLVATGRCRPPLLQPRASSSSALQSYPIMHLLLRGHPIHSVSKMGMSWERENAKLPLIVLPQISRTELHCTWCQESIQCVCGIMWEFRFRQPCGIPTITAQISNGIALVVGSGQCPLGTTIIAAYNPIQSGKASIKVLKTLHDFLILSMFTLERPSRFKMSWNQLRCICFTTDSAIGNTYLRNSVSSNIPHSFITSCKHARHEYFIKRQLGRNGITIGKFSDAPIDRSKQLYAIEMMRVAAELPWLCCKP